MSNWHWDGSVWSFIGIVQWALTIHKAAEDNLPNMMDIAGDRRKLSAKAREYGIDEFSIANEMIRIGQDALKVLQALNKMETNVCEVSKT